MAMTDGDLQPKVPQMLTLFWRACQKTRWACVEVGKMLPIVISLSSTWSGPNLCQVLDISIHFRRCKLAPALAGEIWSVQATLQNSRRACSFPQVDFLESLLQNAYSGKHID